MEVSFWQQILKLAKLLHFYVLKLHLTSQGRPRALCPEQPEISSDVIGKIVMDALSNVDSVAYVRFASVYKNFREARDFEQFIGELSGAKDD